MSRETVACVTTQPARASASSNSNCVPTRFRETTLSISRCRSAFASCIWREYVCRFGPSCAGTGPSHAAQVAVDRSLRRAWRAGDDRLPPHGLAHLAYADRRGTADEEMTAADQKVERAADKLQRLADQMAGEGGLKSKLAEPLAEDADLIRKMKPSLIKARARGEAPKHQTPRQPVLSPPSPQLGKRPKAEGGGPSPWLVVGVALAAGIVLAKWIDWRGHAHPRD